MIESGLYDGNPGYGSDPSVAGHHTDRFGNTVDSSGQPIGLGQPAGWGYPSNVDTVADMLGNVKAGLAEIKTE
jgi:hypothetical protein